ncbi:hypothetical protein GCM10012286_03230 [Streptomyces lasiicapitis]|uniref:Uncharacterized protein n=1 Tax=Streptomyces lasiicapitis TaxID=1923961 RepID=A0ABQ2LHR8_9ACTN|nr:hypothetical protein GCM10012286_03230 [Streptomyces lasiicapitis]
MAGSSAALAEPAAPTTGAAPAATISATRAIRRVRGRDMMLLQTERTCEVPGRSVLRTRYGIRRSDAVTTARTLRRLRYANVKSW